jgi:hypothetical protein
MPEMLESEQPYGAVRDTDTTWWVLGTLTHRDVNLSHVVLREVRGLEGLSVLQKNIFRQATNFRVAPSEGKSLLALVRGRRAPNG